MSSRRRPNSDGDPHRSRLWNVRAPDFEMLFCGTMMELVAELVRLKRAGIDAAAIEARP